MLNLKSSFIPDYIAGENIEQVKEKYNLKKVIKLASNENPYGVPSIIIKKLKKELKNIYRYPDKDYKDLREKIALKLNVSTENIILGNGTDEIFDLIFKALIKPGSKVLIFSPTFPLYKILGKIYSAKILELKLDDLEYNVEKIIKRLDKNLKLVIICNPNNPTGTYISEKSLIKIIEKLNSQTTLLLDEAYANYATADDFPEAVNLFKLYENKKNIIITRTFSKIYSLAGLRIGYGIGNKDFIKVLNKIRMPFNINSLAVTAAKVALDNEKFIKECKFKNFENKNFLYSQLDKLGIEYKKSQANFVLIKLKINAKTVFQNLLKKGIIIRPLNEKGLENYIRVTIGKKKEVKKFLKELKKILKKYY